MGVMRENFVRVVWKFSMVGRVRVKNVTPARSDIMHAGGVIRELYLSCSRLHRRFQLFTKVFDVIFHCFVRMFSEFIINTV